MSWLRNLTHSDNESRELMFTISRSLIFIIGGLFLVWHFIATLTWPRIFSPSLWLSTLMMITVVSLSLRLLDKHYLLAQGVWLGGLVAIVLTTYAIYLRPEILLILIFFPMMAIVTVGVGGSLIFIFTTILLVNILSGFNFIPDFSSGYNAAVILGSLFSVFFGWGLSNNLLSVIDTAAYHFSESRRLLEDARQHRAEIAIMLKDRNQANYQLERLNQMLNFARRRADEARIDRDRFVLAVSHELRSPLNFILGFSDLMVNSPDTYAPLQEWPAGLFDDVQEIYRSSQHLLGLINDILDMGQIDAQRMNLFREPISLENLMTDVQQMLSVAFNQKNLTLHLDIEDSLPEVLADCTRVRQVLLNLVNNSLRFTEHGGVIIKARRIEEAVEICVSDTGSGIAEEDIPKVFDEFRQVGVDPWRRRDGSGLGLSISRRFVELHGGKMWLESQLGKGTTIFFTIPLDVNVLPETVPSATTDRWQDLDKKAKKIVLLLSADPNTQMWVKTWLEGYEVLPITCPEELLENVIQHIPQAIVVDRSLLDNQLLPLRALPYDLPVIGVVFPGIMERLPALPEGVSQYLVKPISRNLLVETVQNLEPHNYNLLVVDDDPVMLRFVEQVLISGGKSFQISTAQTAEDAIRILNYQAVDVLLLDLDLPDQSGWDVIAKIRQGLTRSQPHVVIISALDLPQNLFIQGQSVLDLKLKRPLTTEELSTVLKQMLNQIQSGYPGNSEREKSIRESSS